MRIVVCIKQVPDTTDVKLDPVTHTLIREGVVSIPNPYDLHALTEALRLKEKYGGEVVVVCMGPPQAKTALQKAISMGADEAILLTDRVFAGSDTLATSYILSDAIKKLSADLIFCGKQAIDGDTAQVGPGIATRLGIPQLTYSVKVREIDVANNKIIVERKLEEGIEVVSSPLPALITAVAEMNSVRYATLPDLMRSVSYEPQIWKKENLTLDTGQIGLNGSPTQVAKTFTPPLREAGNLIEANTENISKLVDDLIKVIKPVHLRCD